MSLYADKRNNRILPTHGIYGSLSANLSGGLPTGDGEVKPFIGGEFNLWETKGNLRFYQPIIPGSDRLIFRLNSTLGFIGSTDGSVVPYVHRYRAGGINSVRGYNWYSLGPTLRSLGTEDPGRVDDTLIVGGTSTWINNIELEAPIVKSAGISAVVFFDAGNAFGDPWGEGNVSLAGLRFSYGAGLRWFSPIGPLRFELGFPINPRADEEKSVFDFSIGSFF
jgi:outer membrane protein insertion porin family